METTPRMLWMNEENKRKVIEAYRKIGTYHSKVCLLVFGKMTGQEWAWVRQVYLTHVKDKEV